MIAGADIFLGLSAGGVLKPEHGQGHGAGPADPGAGQSQSGNHAGRGNGDPPRRHDLHRPLGLSEPGQQRAVLSLHLPRRPGCRRVDHQRGDEAGRGERHRRAGARDAVRRGGPRLWRRGPRLRQGLAHPRALRSAPHPAGGAGGGACGHGQRRRHAPAGRHRRLCRKPAALRLPVRLHHAPDLRGRPQVARPRDLCRWRGRARAARRPGGDRGGDRLSDPDRPPGRHRKPPQALRPHHSSGHGLSRSSTRTTIRATATMSQPWSRSRGGAASRRTRPAPWCAPPPR